MTEDYEREVLLFLNKNNVGEQREKGLKDIYLKYYDEPFNFIMQIQSLQNVLKNLCKNDTTYIDVLEEMLDEINSLSLGLEKYKGLNVQQIQYTFIIFKILTL
jgi:hypothetical protein